MRVAGARFSVRAPALGFVGKRAYGNPSPPYWQVTVSDDSSHWATFA